MIYLVERACYQLVSEDAPQVPMDPSVFMLAPCSIMNMEYELQGPGIPFTKQVTVELDYDEFSGTRLMPSLIAPICVLDYLIFL